MIDIYFQIKDVDGKSFVLNCQFDSSFSLNVEGFIRDDIVFLSSNGLSSDLSCWMATKCIFLYMSDLNSVLFSHLLNNNREHTLKPYKQVRNF